MDFAPFDTGSEKKWSRATVLTSKPGCICMNQDDKVDDNRVSIRATLVNLLYEGSQLDGIGTNNHEASGLTVLMRSSSLLWNPSRILPTL